jgi:teichuronic acid biosynthesis glycosyltransferase TuaC
VSLRTVRALVVTNMYPTPAVPNAGPFVAAQVESLRKVGVEVDVLHLPRHESGRRVYRKLGKKVKELVAAGDPDIVHVAYGGVMADVVTRAIRDRPVLVTFHGTDLLAGRASGALAALALRVGVRASRRAAGRAAGIIVVSPKLDAALPGRIDRSRVWIVPNGVDLERFRPLDKAECQRKLEWNPARRHVLFPAPPWRPEKRFALAQAAVALLDEGDGRVELHALDGVPHDDVPVWLNAVDAILLTSSHEGSPVVVKEALACNVPVVSVDVGDIRERISGVDGCFIAAPTPGELAQALRRALEHGPSTGGRERVADLSLERVAARVQRIYASLANGGAPGSGGD